MKLVLTITIAIRSGQQEKWDMDVAEQITVEFAFQVRSS
jgi:hypothetical protein